MPQLKVTVEFCYESDPQHYPEGERDVFGMAEFDRDAMLADPMLLMDIAAAHDYSVQVTPADESL